MIFQTIFATVKTRWHVLDWRKQNSLEITKIRVRVCSLAQKSQNDLLKSCYAPLPFWRQVPPCKTPSNSGDWSLWCDGLCNCRVCMLSSSFPCSPCLPPLLISSCRPSRSSQEQLWLIWLFLPPDDSWTCRIPYPVFWNERRKRKRAFSYSDESTFMQFNFKV